MKPSLFLSVFLAAALLAGGAYAQSPANNQPTASSAKKKRAAVAPAPAYGCPPSGSKWRGPDPSCGPGTAEMRELQRRGACVIDEGYGRFTFCDRY